MSRCVSCLGLALVLVTPVRSMPDAAARNGGLDVAWSSAVAIEREIARIAASLGEVAALATHESFHIYQRERHPGWIANEADLFTYPIDSAELLALRRLEKEAFRRALSAPGEAGAACWARGALAIRNQRFTPMESIFAAYERKTELVEDLATSSSCGRWGAGRPTWPCRISARPKSAGAPTTRAPPWRSFSIGSCPPGGRASRLTTRRSSIRP